MSRKKTNYMPVLLILLALAACGSPQDSPTPTATFEPLGPFITAEPTSQVDPAPTAIPPTPTEPPLVQIGEFYLLPETPPPPADYVDAMQAKVDAGEWTYGEGLANVLKIYAGELDPLAVFPVQPRETGEMFRIVRLSREYLAAGQGGDAGAEIERLLALFVPDVESLLQYAIPEPQGALPNGFRSGLPAGVQVASLAGAPPLKPAGQAGTLCSDLWEDGFPSGSAATCFQYTAQDWGTGSGRVFYPSAWYPSDPRMAFAIAAAAGLADSARVFAPHGTYQSIDLVFSELAFNTGTADALGLAEGKLGDPKCTIVIFPIQLSAANAQGIDVLKQTVTHEAFHCFQDWNMPAMGNYGENVWWAEGSAEYFSNVVYPAVNDEWSRIEDFSMKSADTPLSGMSYENTVFFQYLGNTIGDAAIIGIMKSIPGSGAAASIAAFAAYPNMAGIFQDFAQAFMDLEIADTGGAMLPVRPYIDGAFKKDVAGDTNFSTDAKAFVLRRYLIAFSTESLYAIVQKPTGSGIHTARPAFTRQTWGGMPGIINGGCDEQAYVFVMTNVDASAAYNVGFEITNEEDVKCDKCLLGDWQLDLPTFAEYIMYDMYEDEELSYEINTITGSHDLTMTPTGYYESEYNDLLVDTTMFFGSPDEGQFETPILHFTTGNTIGRFWVSLSSGNLIFVANQSDVVVATTVNGKGGDPRPLAKDLDVVGPGQPYQCDAQTLAIMVENIDGSPATSLYNRVSAP